MRVPEYRSAYTVLLPRSEPATLASWAATPAELDFLLAVETPRRVAREATIAFRGKPLAVPPEYLGQHVWLQLLGDQITVRANNQTIAQYSAAEV